MICWKSIQGRIQDFKLGEGADLKKLRRAEGSPKIFGVFRVKNHDFTQKKIIFFSILGGRPLDSPLVPSELIRNKELQHTDDFIYV